MWWGEYKNEHYVFVAGIDSVLLPMKLQSNSASGCYNIIFFYLF